MTKTVINTLSPEEWLDFYTKNPAMFSLFLDYVNGESDRCEAENARLLVENAQYKEIEAANKETIQYWRGEVARLKDALESITKMDTGELGSAYENEWPTIREALGEQS